MKANPILMPVDPNAEKYSVDYELTEAQKAAFAANEDKLKHAVLGEEVVFENTTLGEVLAYFQAFAHENDQAVFPSKPMDLETAIDSLTFALGMKLSDVRDYLNANFAQV